MLATLIGYEQPGVAARIVHHGVGEFIEIGDLTVEGPAGLIENVLKKVNYHDKARYFQKVIAETRGVDRAADTIEKAFSGSGVAPLAEEHGAQRTRDRNALTAIQKWLAASRLETRTSAPIRPPRPYLSKCIALPDAIQEDKILGVGKLL